MKRRYHHDGLRCRCPEIVGWRMDGVVLARKRCQRPRTVNRFGIVYTDESGNAQWEH